MTPTGSPRPEPSSTPGRVSALAMVALRAASVPERGALLAAIRTGFPDLRAPVEVGREDNVVTARIPGGFVAVAVMGSPIPWDDLEWPAKLAWQWPQATEVLRAHAAHAIVHVVSDQLDTIDVRLLLTRLVAAVVASSDPAGVYWGDALAVHEPSFFLEQAADASRDSLPLMLWLGFHPFEDDEGVSAYTLGMRAFDHMELEVEKSQRSVSEVLASLGDVAHYLLTTGAEIADGDTVGSTADERVRVRHAPAMLDPTRTVYKIALD
ncbi:MAG TPA: DUF4261 domain-containing protein [Gemmatimonadaceae bacterium]|nr:DUF4261 domain-containing protein [Gemmatimonadaceae bacterium]